MNEVKFIIYKKLSRVILRLRTNNCMNTITREYLDSRLSVLKSDIVAEMYKTLLIHGLIVVATIVAVAKAF